MKVCDYGKLWFLPHNTQRVAKAATVNPGAGHQAGFGALGQNLK